MGPNGIGAAAGTLLFRFMFTMTAGRWLLVCRIIASLTVVVVIGSFTTAGLLMQGNDAKEVHGAAAIALHVFSGVLCLCLAGLASRERRHWWAVGVSFLVFAYSFLQAYWGEDGTLSLHIPGAFFVAAAVVGLTVWLFAAGQRPLIGSSR